MVVAHDGQLVLLLGTDHKEFLVRLRSGERLQTHRGILFHSELIGKPIGSPIRSHLGYRFFLLVPSWDDLIRHIRRNSQIVYPKDMGYILLKMAIRPGSRVVEAGSGSGAMTAGLASAVGPDGHVYSYDVREDMLTLARRNVERLGLADLVTFKQRDIAKGFDETDVDALFLDVPDPWNYLSQAHAALSGGGFWGSIVPTANQVVELLRALERMPFASVEVQELLLRGYKTVAARLRPMDRMVAHTGFLVFARALVVGDEEE